MKTIIFSILLYVSASYGLFAQESITLETCYQSAIENYPLTRQKELLPISNELKVKNLNKNYLPEMMVNGQAHYQSDVTKTPFQNASIPGIEPIPTVANDWYKISLDVHQVIYDGSTTGRQKTSKKLTWKLSNKILTLNFIN